jgi:hypothetical protein
MGGVLFRRAVPTLKAGSAFSDRWRLSEGPRRAAHLKAMGCSANLLRRPGLLFD